MKGYWTISIVFVIALMFLVASSQQASAQLRLPVDSDGKINVDIELTELELTGIAEIPFASDPANNLGDSIDGYGFVNSEVTISLSAVPQPVGTRSFYPDGGLFPPGAVTINNGDILRVDSFFDVFFDITVTDIDSRTGRNFAGQSDGASIVFVNNNIQLQDSHLCTAFPLLFINLHECGLQENSPLLDPLVEIPLGGDINGNGENDKIKVTLFAIAATFTGLELLPSGQFQENYDTVDTGVPLVTQLSGAVVDESTDPPFSVLFPPSTMSIAVFNFENFIVELCSNGIDDTANGLIDCADPQCTTDPFCDVSSGIDADEDGHDSESTGGDDCDDTDPTVNPSATEACDNVDNDCDGEVDTDTVFQGDECLGFCTSRGEAFPICQILPTGSIAICAPGDGGPLTAEICDTVDNDCDDQVDEDLPTCGPGGSCVTDDECFFNGEYCNGQVGEIPGVGFCQPPKEDGQSCDRNAQCESLVCENGFCGGQCVPETTCNGNGVCDSAGLCECTGGFSGDDCSVPPSPCTDPQIENSNSSACDGVSPGETCDAFRCDSGFEPSGPAPTCQDGSWENIPTCDPLFCPSCGVGTVPLGDDCVVDPALTQQIADLQADLTTCSGDLATCDSDLTTTQADLTTCRGNLDTCDDDLTTCSGDLATCDSELTTLQAELATAQQQIAEFEEILLSGEITICHKGKDQTISLSGLGAHLNHGDTIGACE